MATKSKKKKKKKEEEITPKTNLYYNTLTKLPESVLLEGFRDILASFRIKLPDYETRKLLYNILVGIGFFFFKNPDKRIDLEHLTVFRDRGRRSVFAVEIPQWEYYDQDINVGALKDYFIGGGLDYEELGVQLDQYALSFIKETGRRISRKAKAREVLRRYIDTWKDVDDAIRILKFIGCPSDIRFIRAVEKLSKKLEEDRKEEDK